MKQQYLLTERAHFMCPNMHFGICMELQTAYDAHKLENTLLHLADAHPFLRCVIAEEPHTNRLYYKITDTSKIEWQYYPTDTLWEDYKSLSTDDWNVFAHGLLKVYVYPSQSSLKVLLVAHHLLADGRGLLELAQEFANDYCEDIVPVSAPEQLIESIEQLPNNSCLTGISHLLVKQANKQWKKENHTVSYEQYREFVQAYDKSHPVSHECYSIKPNELGDMLTLCHKHGFTINDYLMAQMYIQTGTDKIIIAADIRNSFTAYQPGSMGNYATAMGIKYNPRKKTADPIQVAKKIHQLVQKHMNNHHALYLVLACYLEIDPTLLDASVISAMNGFDSKAGRFVGSSMFGMSTPKSYSITNLGKIENKNMQSLLFIPPASPAALLTLGVVTINGRLFACTSKNRCILQPSI